MIPISSRKAAGICFKCGINPAKETSFKCAPCTAYTSRKSWECMERKRVLWRASGLCPRCGGVPRPGGKWCRDCVTKEARYRETMNNR